MNVKGFILEDDKGREFVMAYEKLSPQPGRTFLLRGWQRRRLVPLQCSEQELRRIVGGVLVTLDDLFKSLPRFSDSLDAFLLQSEGSLKPPLRKPPALRKVGRGASYAAK
ncbi:MAG TPA: hypothetical protein PKD12_15215 [Nitrospira sp.]|nr:hypothetical protein [Nitrospira sp.]